MLMDNGTLRSAMIEHRTVYTWELSIEDALDLWCLERFAFPAQRITRRYGKI